MWNNLRTEYKFAIILVVIFLPILIIFMIKNNTIENAIFENKKEKLRDCITYDYDFYSDYTCTIKDEKGKSFTINYPQLGFNTNDADSVNAEIKRLYEKSLKELFYIVDENDGSLIVTDYMLMKYDVYNYNNIVSVVISYNYISSGEEFYNRKFKIYNFSKSSGKLISNDDFMDKFNIDRNFSVKLKSEIVKMYATEHLYDFYGELQSNRDNLIDSSINNFSLNSIDKLYVMNDGSIGILLNLNDPDYGFKKYYLFSYKDNTFSYKFADTKAPTNGALVN